MKPLVPPPTPRDAARPPSAYPGTVLVVDDEAAARALVAHHLQRAGYRVVTAADGREALDQARAIAPDLIVLDLMLPEMDGISVCEMLRQLPETRATPVVMLTAWATELARRAGLAAGANEYLIKPFSPRELVERVATFLPRTGLPPLAPAPHVRELRIDFTAGRVAADGREICLNDRDFRILSLLLEVLLSRSPVPMSDPS